MARIVQGNLLALDRLNFKISSNSLQSIAVGYAFTAIAYLYLKPSRRILLFISCLLAYALLLTILIIHEIARISLTHNANFALYVGHIIFGSFDYGKQDTWFYLV